MGQLEKYRTHIKRILNEYAKYKPSHGEIETEAIFDVEKDHYEVVHVGWHNKKRIHGSVIHIDIKDGKVWIQHDGTSDGIADELVEAGIPKEDIVLGFRYPKFRKYTEYAAIEG
ncbi:MAG: XisI protein [candidate division KSB1 bacterium]|nr:XisI protein [candidate division KSB1 bacterium]MDZ7366343.1 XisI protein [candidate division KSB1 bacterium]MDZ7403998.1 XisI protein [candidate division KSB1 bacterium]